MVASHALLGLFGLEGLVFPIRSHTGHELVVASTVNGLHVLHAVQGGILALPIQFLIPFVFFRVPLFLRGLAQSWRIHAPIPVIGRRTRPPTHVTFGKGLACSDDPWHDGPSVAAQFARGSGGNSPDSGDALGSNAWLGIGYRPVGSPLGLWLSALVWGLVWVEGGLELPQGGPPFTFLLQHSLLVFHIPLVLQLSRLLGIFVGHLEQH